MLLVNPLTGRSYTHECKSCGKRFVTGHGKQVYCSQSCGMTCVQCKKSFKTSHRDRGSARFCSQACRSEFVLIETTCAICGKKWRQNRHGGFNVTCSEVCARKLQHQIAHKSGRHYNWRGGRHVDGSGYIKVFAPDHPNANRKYVLEHRLIMERHLGRLLRDNENVHHKNGVRSDNRLTNGHELGGCPSTCCNLELWAISQPKGQRVSDLIDWAGELLRLYVDERAAS